MDSTVAKSPASMPGSEAARIRTLVRQQKFSETLAAGEALLAVVPDHRDVLLYVAIAQRYLGRIPGALRTLAALEQRHPRFSRLHEERGRCFVDMKQAPQAIEAFLRAVNINPALPASWRMLDGLYRMTGQAENAAMAASHVATLQNLPPEVMTATGLFADGDLDAAEPLVRAYLLKHGNHVEGMRLLARIGIARGVLDDAELLLEAVLELAPGYRVARQEYAEVLIDLHKYSQARRELDRLLAEDPKNRLLKTLYATSSVGLGDHERAIGLYRELLRGTPEDADLHLSIAHAQKTLGRRQEAIDSYRRAAACRPAFGDAYWSLANLKTYRFTNEELTRLRAAESAPTTVAVDRYHLSFALGKALEDQAEFPESFRYYELGNALKRSASKYRPDIVENNTRQQIEVCTREFFAMRQGVGSPDRVLPGRILRIHHEDVVDDLEGNVRRMLDFCGLEFEPRCIEFHKTERSVRTASSEQVRQPIFREGLDQWRHFEPWLEPLKNALGDALNRYRDE
jgi:tetratricopeptide (TPR) repeat protein